MSKKTQNAIKWMCNDIRDLLIEKNKAYGNSAIDPENIFSKLCNCSCNVELSTSDKFSDYSEGYAPPWSQEIEKVTVFVSDPGDEMKPIKSERLNGA